jgi:hypothetical protein
MKGAGIAVTPVLAGGFGAMDALNAIGSLTTAISTWRSADYVGARKSGMADEDLRVQRRLALYSTCRLMQNLYANLRALIALPVDRVDVIPFENFVGLETLTDWLTSDSVNADYRIAIRRTIHNAMCGTFADVVRRIGAIFRRSTVNGYRGRCAVLLDWNDAMQAGKGIETKNEGAAPANHPLALTGYMPQLPYCLRGDVYDIKLVNGLLTGEHRAGAAGGEGGRRVTYLHPGAPATAQTPS